MEFAFQFSLVVIDLLEEWMRAMMDVVQSGRVKYVGLRAHALRACTMHDGHVDGMQSNLWRACSMRGRSCSLATREPVESRLVAVCKELGVSIVAFSRDNRLTV